MKKSRFTETQIVSILSEADAVTKAISAKGRRPVAANTLLYDERALFNLRLNLGIR